MNVILLFQIFKKHILDKKLTLARKKRFYIYSNLSSINIHYYLKHRIPMGQRLFF